MEKSEARSYAAEIALQRDYYADTAARYDAMHRPEDNAFSFAWLCGYLGHFGATSLLEVGAGTGLTLQRLKTDFPAMRVIGIEPVAELREIGVRQHGLSPDVLQDGDATKLDFADEGMDVVCAFSVLHHVKTPALAISEMMRVARKAVFIADGNNFGQGSAAARLAKRALRRAGLWRAYDCVRTRGRGYHVSEGDGIYYSFSLFDHLDQIAAASKAVHIMNPDGGACSNLFRDAPSVAILAIKTH